MEETFIAGKPNLNDPWDTIIIGSGPSGLTAAIYTTRAALSTLVLAGAKWGGQLMLTTEVDNFPGFPEGIQGPELMEKMRNQAQRFGAEIVFADVENIDETVRPFKVNADGKIYYGKSIIIATGADSLWLGIPGEANLIGRGVSSCAPCDAPFFKGKKVVVVGGGDSAMEEALVLTKYASDITILHRRDSFKASEIMQKKVLSDPKIKVVWNSEVMEILGGDKVSGVKIKNNQTNETSELNVDGVFVAIGHSPSTKIFQNKIELDEKGYVVKAQNSSLAAEQANVKTQIFQTATSVEGIFVAGDVHDYHYRQAVTAAGFGCMSAMDVEKWLERNKN